MKFQLTRNSNQDFTLHFDRPLPRLAAATLRPFFIPSYDLLRASTPRARKQMSRVLARLNAGQTPFELPAAAKTYREFLESLVPIPGLISTGECDRYSVTIQVGTLFDPLAVGTRIAECLQRFFYPDEQLEMLEGSQGDANEPGGDRFDLDERLQAP